ncbi:MAG: PqqD family protein [Marinosulfonomonas sp.]|nr:PqqD family protein [Marinosulfonomonas sp.]
MYKFDLKLRGLRAPVRVIGLQEPELLFSEYFKNWPYDISPHSETEPFATLKFDGEQYLLKSNAAENPIPYKSPVNAICDLVAAAARQRADERPEEMCLHAASVQIGAALVVFPAVRRAGKSSLTMALAAKGMAVFGDDVLPVTSHPGAPVMGNATGSPIRLRLPLPPALPDGMADYIDTYRGPQNKQYLYVSPPEIAPHGRQAPIGALIHLERGDDIAAKLVTLSPGIMLSRLLKQNFARSANADRILADLFTLAQNTPVFLLRYSDIGDAVDLLIGKFQDQPAPNKFVPERCVPQSARNVAEIPAGPDLALRQISTAQLRQLGGEHFATNQSLTRVLHLNEGAVRIWKLLEQPTSETDAIEILHTAFPDAPLDEIQADTQNTIRDLKSAGLLKLAGS